jgi:ribosomal protein L14E/L6E/L27E
MNDYLGLMVISLAGRDKGRIAAVVGVVDENYVLIADGRTRKTESPKRRN